MGGASGCFSSLLRDVSRASGGGGVTVSDALNEIMSVWSDGLRSETLIGWQTSAELMQLKQV